MIGSDEMKLNPQDQPKTQRLDFIPTITQIATSYEIQTVMQTKHAEATIVTLKNYAAYLEKGEQQFLTDPSIKH